MGLSDQNIIEISEKYGTGKYILKRETLAGNVESFRSILPNLELAYSVKANYRQEILTQLNELNVKFDCASLKELKLLISAGVEYNVLWLNSPYLDRKIMQFCLDNNVMVVLDSLDQLRNLERLSRQLGTKAKIGLRVNITTEGISSRFGVDYWTERKEIFALLASPNLTFEMLHSHYSGPNRGLAMVEKRWQQLIEVWSDVSAHFPVPNLNFGGGIAGPMTPELAKQFEYDVPNVADYLHLLGRLLPKNLNCKITIEPGMALVANTVDYLSKVCSLKTVGTRKMALLDASNLFLKPTGHKTKIMFRVMNLTASDSGEFELVGMTCMEIDKLGVHAGNLSPGDLVYFENLGAYVQSYRPDFIFDEPDLICL